MRQSTSILSLNSSCATTFTYSIAENWSQVLENFFQTIFNKVRCCFFNFIHSMKITLGCVNVGMSQCLFYLLKRNYKFPIN